MKLIEKPTSQKIPAHKACNDYELVGSWVEIDKNALMHNLTNYKKILGSSLLAPVIKSNAYGHGLIEVAQICQKSFLADWLCVATLSEALQLRQSKIILPILVLSNIDCNPELAVNKNIDFVISNAYIAHQLHNVGKKNKFIFNIHIKIDTGLSRLGILTHDASEFILQLKKLSHINITGLCTHFAESQKDDQKFTRKQYALFKKTLNSILKIHKPIQFIHAANTAGTTTIQMPECNMERIGCGIYGFWPSQITRDRTIKKYPNFSLVSAFSLKTRIIEIKTIHKGNTIGYDRTLTVTKKTKIGILPIGYFDGYDRRLSNRALVRINGQYAPIVGRISMNLTIIDISSIDPVSIGDQVLMIGNYPHIHAQEIADLLGDCNVRELTTKINPFIPRIVKE